MRTLLSKTAGILVLLSFISGCLYQLPQSAWKVYDPNKTGAYDIAPRLNVVIVDFEEGEIETSGFPFNLPVTAQTISGTSEKLDPFHRRFAKWLSEELDASHYFQSVKYLDSKDKTETSDSSDIIVTGRLGNYKMKGFSSLFLFPPQSLLFIFGVPLCCWRHEWQMEVRVSLAGEPEKILLQKELIIKDPESPWISTYSKKFYYIPYQYIASRQKILLKNAYLEFREELAKEVMPGGSVYEAVVAEKERRSK